MAYGKLFDDIIEDGHDVRALVLCSGFPTIFTAGLDRVFNRFHRMSSALMPMQSKRHLYPALGAFFQQTRMVHVYPLPCTSLYKNSKLQLPNLKVHPSLSSWLSMVRSLGWASTSCVRVM